LTSGFYHAGDESTFEEGYVALTRARKQSRIYIVESQEEPDEEWGHRAHEKKHVGLGTVTQALEQRAAPGLAHELDPLAAEALARFDDRDEVSLLEEQRRLEGVLAQAPPSHSRVLRAASRELERLLVTTRVSAGDAGAARRLTALASVTERLAAEEVRRSAFFHEHADDDTLLALVNAARGQRALRADIAAFAAGWTPEEGVMGIDEADHLELGHLSEDQQVLPGLGIEPPGL
jgi:ATP-dependent exoDNAse (exonuclease V) beta subunit